MNEYIEIVATWEHAVNTKQYNCKVNIKNMREDKVKIEGWKNRNGCENRVLKQPRQTHDSIHFHSCYCNHLSSSFEQYLFIQDQYSKGFLPYPGTTLEQPNKVMDVIQLITKLKQDRQQKLENEQNKQVKSNKRTR